MFLKRFVFINWGNVPSIEFNFGPINLFSGGNGSGKTTAADAIQTIMTAAHENLFQYNPGQDETTQRGRGGKRVRTVSSYILGCDDGSYSRLDPTDGYLAAVFHPNQGESAAPFTAVIAVRAWLDKAGNTGVARQDDAQFLILPEVELEQRHFIDDSSEQKRVVALTEFHQRLVQELGKSRVERYDAKKAYLRRLYGVLRGKNESVSDIEAISAARAFSRFMAYKPVKSINRFVADEILEQKDLGEAIRSVSSQLKTIHGMERDSAQLVASIETLSQAKGYAQSYIDQWIELNLQDYTLAQAEYEVRQQDYLNGKSQQKLKQAELLDTEKAITMADDEGKSIRQQLINLEAQRQGVDALRQKDELDKLSQGLNDKLVACVKKVLEEDQLLNTNLQACEDLSHPQAYELARSLSAHSVHEAKELTKSVLDSSKDVLSDIHHLVQHDAISAVSTIKDRFDRLLEVQTSNNRLFDHWHSKDETGSQRDQLAESIHTQKTRYTGLKTQREEKRREIDKLGANQVSYPGYVERAISAIKQQCPGADPHVLCDHIEVKDPQWQAAIEGYLGGARFSIVVAEDYEADAIRVVRRLPGRDNRARVIQGRKASQDARKISLDSQSIIHTLEFSHAVVKSYVTASYGTVLRVDSPEQLRSTRRGITAEGMGSGNYSMWRCDVPDSELVFGVAAREKALAAKQQELESIEVQLHQSAEQIRRGDSLLKSIDTLRITSYADELQDVISIHRQIEENASLLGQLDLSEHQDLEERLNALQTESDELKTKEAKLHTQKGRLETELERIDKQLKALSHLQDQNLEKVEHHENALQNITSVWPDFDLDAHLNQADQEAKELNLDHAKNQRMETEKSLHHSERRMGEEILSHNQNCRPADAVIYASFNGDYGPELFQSICDLSRELDRIHNILKNNILVEKHAQLAELKEAFNNTFVTHLCHAIYQALGEGKRQIELLNKELTHHRFGADRETFRFASEWVPEYRDYARFFEEVIQSPGQDDQVSLFDASLSERSSKVRDELMSMLLDEDEVRAMRDLERVADYRNYRRYEIYKEVEGKEPIPLSEYGTGSGGQLETPAYIIRSAAITSAFRFADGDTHLRMVLVDEAFSKMDETRSREVIKYLSESLGLQLIFIMPTSKCGPYMDLISNEFVFAKVPSSKPRGQLSTRVLVDRKQCNQGRIKELWDSHRKSIYQQAELDFMEEFATG